MRLDRRVRNLTAAVIAAATMTGLVGGAPVHAQGVPWTATIPHPDTVDWASPDRPGYRYRGMLPAQERFYSYIQGKRLRGEPLSGLEVTMVRWLQAARRWPEAPRPNATARAYLNYLRELPSDEMTVAQQLMVAQMRAQGLLPLDREPGPEIRRLTEHLTSDAFRARNWFERIFGRAEPWMEFVAASQGVVMRGGPVTPGLHQSPRVPGVQIRYSIIGAQIDPVPTDPWLRQYQGTPAFEMAAGVPQPGQVTVVGTVTSDDAHQVSFLGHLFSHAALMEEWDVGKLRSRDVHDEIEFTVPPGGSRAFAFTTPTLPRWEPGNPNSYGHVRITLRTECRNVTGGQHFAVPDSRAVVAFLLEPCPTAWAAWANEETRQRADAAWRAQVERTLQELGYEQTPAGREVARMRAALARGDAGWQEYVSGIERRLAAEDGAPERELDALMAAAEAGGPAWEGYVATHGGTGSAPAGGPDAPPVVDARTAPPEATVPPPAATGELADVGGLTVGTGQAQGQVVGAARHFDQTGRVTGVMRFTDLPAGSTAVGVWHRDGVEITRSEQTVGGTGWMSFSLRTPDAAGLRPGTYTLTITVAGTVLGRTTFTVGPTSRG